MSRLSLPAMNDQAKYLSEYLLAVRQPVDHWNLFELGLHLGRIVYPLDSFSDAYAELDRIAQRVRGRCEGCVDLYETIQAINETFFEEWQFRGNVEDYHNTDNSFINRLLETKRGIPISLCILYREVAQRVGVELDCVGMPGHFILKLQGTPQPLFLDAFFRGELLTEPECAARMKAIVGDDVAFDREFLEPLQNDAVVLRMLLNLKQIYAHQEDGALLVEVLDRRIPLLDQPHKEILERGLVRAHLGKYVGALEDLQYFLEHSDDEDVKQAVATRLEKLRRLAAKTSQ